jgi:hypothetical protein
MNNEELIAKMISDRPSNLVPSMTINDLKRFSRINLKKKKNLRKFLKSPARYIKEKIWREYLAKIMALPLMRSLNYSEIGRKLIMIDELPQDAYARYQEGVIKTGNEILVQQNPDKQLKFKAQIANFDQPNLNGNVYTKEALVNAFANFDPAKSNCDGFAITCATINDKGVEIVATINNDSMAGQALIKNIQNNKEK